MNPFLRKDTTGNSTAFKHLTRFYHGRKLIIIKTYLFQLFTHAVIKDPDMFPALHSRQPGKVKG